MMRLLLSPILPSLHSRRYCCPHNILSPIQVVLTTRNVVVHSQTIYSSSLLLLWNLDRNNQPTHFNHHHHHHHQRRCYMTTTKASSSNSDNIQSQQRIKRFYKNVNVVEMNQSNMATSFTTTSTSTTTMNFAYPQLPPSQLRVTASTTTTTTTTTNDKDDTTSTTATATATTVTDSSSSSSSSSSSKGRWYTITLDGKQLRTPLGQVVMVPSMTLAYMIAIEWDAVTTTHIIPNQMPMMTYVCTVLDQVMKHKKQYEELCWQYVMTDTLGYPANPIYEPILYQQQQKAWLPIKHWIHSTFCNGGGDGGGSSSSTTTSSSSSSSSNPLSSSKENDNPWKLPSVLLPELQPIPRHSTNNNNNKTNALISSSLSNNHTDNNHNTFVQKIQYDPELLFAIRKYISTLDVWYLLALYIGCKECKSFWLSCALLLTHTNHHPSLEQHHHPLQQQQQQSSSSSSLQSNNQQNRMYFTPAQIQTAARIEEEMNIQDWGFVEGQHDYDRLNAAIQIRSIALYVQSLNQEENHNEL